MNIKKEEYAYIKKLISFDQIDVSKKKGMNIFTFFNVFECFAY